MPRKAKTAANQTRKKKTAAVKTKRRAARRIISARVNPVAPPVVAGPDRLPLLDHNFSWERFEGFALRLFAILHPELRITKYGKRGDDQRGLDLQMKTRSGKLVGIIQCKRYERFNVGQVKRAKRELEVKPKRRILLISCESTAKVRDEVERSKGWELWDINDISNAVIQKIPATKRFNLLKPFFGVEWANAFCNVDPLSSLSSWYEFFRRLRSRDDLFNHCSSFTGRSSEMTQIKSFLEGPSSALTLVAAGGMGKSRLLLEASKAAELVGWQPVFVQHLLTPRREDYLKLTDRKCVFIFDDAHRVEQLREHLSLIKQLDRPVKLILGTRPQARTRLQLDLVAELNLESRTTVELLLRPLTLEDSKTLVKTEFPAMRGPHLTALANLIHESPLIGLMACNLVRRKEINLGKLATERDLKNKVLSSFEAELLGRVSKKSNEAVNRSVLDAFAAFGPIYTSSNNLKTLEVFTEFSEREVSDSLRELKQSGLLKERGGKTRIVPDILADHILEGLCFDDAGDPSNFISKALAIGAGELRQNLIKNVAELDWRRGCNDTASNSILLKDFWQRILCEIPSMSFEELKSLGEIVKEIAFFQPGEAILAIKKILDASSTTLNSASGYADTKHFENLITACRDIVVAGQSISESLELIWQLAKSDDRQTNSNPGHGIRVLHDLLSYEMAFSVPHLREIFLGVKAIVETDTYDSDHSPIELFEGLLVKSIVRTHYESRHFVMTPFLISYERTKHLRFEVLGFLKQLVCSSNIRDAMYAQKALKVALEPPAPLVGMRIKADQVEAWSDEVDWTVNALIHCYENTPHSLVKLFIKKTLRNFAKGFANVSARSKAKEFAQSCVPTREERRYALFSPFRTQDVLFDSREDDFQERMTKTSSVASEIVEEMRSEFQTTDAFVAESIRILDSYASVNFLKGQINLHYIEDACLQSEAIDNESMACSILRARPSMFSSLFGNLLNKVAERSVDRAFQLADDAIEQNDFLVLTALARVFWRLFLHYRNPNVNLMFEKLLMHENPGIADRALESLKDLARVKQPEFLAWLDEFEVRSQNNAVTLAGLFTPHGALLGDIPKNNIRALCKRFASVRSLDGFEIEQFIQSCGELVPDAVIELFIERATLADRDEESHINFMPYQGFPDLKLAISSEAKKRWLEVIASLHLTTESNAAKHHLARLFWELTRSEQKAGLLVIQKLFQSAHEQSLETAGALLSEYPQSLLQTERDWCADLLKQLKLKSEKSYEEFERTLFYITIRFHGAFSRNETEEILIQQADARLNLETEELMRRLWKRVRNYATEQIERMEKWNDEND